MKITRTANAIPTIPRTSPGDPHPLPPGGGRLRTRDRDRAEHDREHAQHEPEHNRERQDHREDPEYQRGDPQPTRRWRARRNDRHHGRGRRGGPRHSRRDHRRARRVDPDLGDGAPAMRAGGDALLDRLAAVRAGTGHVAVLSPAHEAGVSRAGSSRRRLPRRRRSRAARTGSRSARGSHWRPRATAFAGCPGA